MNRVNAVAPECHAEPPPSPVVTPLRTRLSLLMFLQYAPPGAVLPTYSYQLHALHFDAFEIAACCATQALACVVGPLAAGQIADRYFPAERCITFCATLAGVLLLVLADLTTPVAVFAATLGFWLLISPVFTLGTSLSFAHLRHPDRDFGPVRMWGTVGWVSAALFLGHWYGDPDWLCACVRPLRPDCPHHCLPDAYRLGALLCFVLAAYSLTLPHTPPQRHAATWLAPLEALRLLRWRPFAVYFGCVLGLYVTLPFATQVTPLLLKQLGVSDAALPPTLTLCQSFEIISLAVLPMVLLRFGVRGSMLIGLGAWLLAFAILTAGEPLWLVVASLVLNGLFITCFVVAGQVFINRHAHGDIRASAQALLVCTMGTGLLVGNLAVGVVRRWTDNGFVATFAVATAVTLLVFLAFLAGFDDAEVGDENVAVSDVTHGATVHFRVERSSADG